MYMCVRKLTGCEYRIMPDRIAAATYISAAAITNGEITIKDIRPAHIDSFITCLSKWGAIYIHMRTIYTLMPKAIKIYQNYKNNALSGISY